MTSCAPAAGGMACLHLSLVKFSDNDKHDFYKTSTSKAHAKHKQSMDLFENTTFVSNKYHILNLIVLIDTIGIAN